MRTRVWPQLSFPPTLQEAFQKTALLPHAGSGGSAPNAKLFTLNSHPVDLAAQQSPRVLTPTVCPLFSWIVPPESVNPSTWIGRMEYLASAVAWEGISKAPAPNPTPLVDALYNLLIVSRCKIVDNGQGLVLHPSNQEPSLSETEKEKVQTSYGWLHGSPDCTACTAFPPLHRHCF